MFTTSTFFAWQIAGYYCKFSAWVLTNQAVIKIFSTEWFFVVLTVTLNALDHSRCHKLSSWRECGNRIFWASVLQRVSPLQNDGQCSYTPPQGSSPTFWACAFSPQNSGGLPSYSQVYLGPIRTVLGLIKHIDPTNPESSSFFLRDSMPVSRLKSQKGNSVEMCGLGQVNLHFLVCKTIRGILICVRISVANVRNPIQNGLSQRGFISSCSKRKDAREESSQDQRNSAGTQASGIRTQDSQCLL